MLQGHRFLRAPYVGGALTFLPTVCRRLPRAASAIRATDAAGESSASGLKHCRTARRKAKPTPMALGCCIGCATKKVSKKVARNAIPRSCLPSERKIAHSRVSCLYPTSTSIVRSRKYFLNLRLNGRDLLCDLWVARAAASRSGGPQYQSLPRLVRPPQAATHYKESYF